MNWMQTIQQAALFRNFTYDEFEQILPGLHGNIRTIKKDAILLNEGELVSWGGIVISGSLATIKIQFNGTISILDFIFPSKIFALDMALTPSKISALSIQALEDSVLYIFPFGGIETFDWMTISQKDRMINNMLMYLANENVRKQHKIEVTSQHSLRGRVLSYLYFMAGRHESTTFFIPYSREQLANYLCVNRSTLSHELSSMRSEGLIDFKKNRFTILTNRLPT